MKKRWLLITGGVIVVALLALVALPFLIDVNRFRPQLEAEASAGLGRTVKLGNLNLSILSGRIVASDIEIADDPAFSQSAFLKAKSVKIGIELKPLIFARQLNVTGIVIDQPQINLLKAADGTFNFSSLGNSSQPVQIASGPNHPPLSVARFNVKDGTLTVGRLNSSAEPRVYSDVNIAVTDFSRTSQFHFLITARLPGGGNTNLSGQVGPIRFAHVTSTPFDASATVHNMKISAYGFIDPRSGISGQIDMDGKVVSDGSTATATGTFTGSSMTFGPGGKPSPKAITIQNKVEIDLSTQSLKITQSDISIGKAKFQLTGTIQSQGEQRALNLQLTGKSVPIDDLQAVLPSIPVRLPLGSHLQGGTLSVNFRITGPLSSPVISGPVQAADTTLVGYNLGEQIGSLASFAGKAISKPDTYVQSMSCDTTVTLAGSTSTNINAVIPSVATSTGSGTASPDGTLHYEILSYPSSGIAGDLIKMSNVGSGKGAIPITIQGTVERPIYVADTKGAARSIVGQTAKGVVSATGHAISGLFKKKDKDKDPDKK
ncbi:MAG TPA: AsmA family protein [Acidobacteriaceae bacterium]|nr:AsmA family protein [Acidobacteriaceae bacterium]